LVSDWHGGRDSVFPTFSGIEDTGVVNMKETVRTVEEEQIASVVKKEYGRPQLTVYEDLKTVTARIS
jgi:hypothetical protein